MSSTLSTTGGKVPNLVKPPSGKFSSPGSCCHFSGSPAGQQHNRSNHFDSRTPKQWATISKHMLLAKQVISWLCTEHGEQPCDLADLHTYVLRPCRACAHVLTPDISEVQGL